MKALKFFAAIGIAALALSPIHSALSSDTTQYWLKIRAKDKFARSLVANTGVSIEVFRDDFVVAIGNLEEKNAIAKLGLLETSFALTDKMDFPRKDADYHNYTETKEKLEGLQQKYPQIAKVFSIGTSVEGRDILGIRLSGNMAVADSLPAVIYMGGHHAREHLSVELPIRYAEYLATEYAQGNPRIVNLLNGRDVHIIPAVNPDGLEWDIQDGNYKAWRKNRSRNKDGSFGVDLNRNYAYDWGTGGSSRNGSSDTFMGPAPFSEPETLAVKNYVEAHQNITILLSFHTFSELILYPWGSKYDPIGVVRDRQVHEVMANKMAEWNDYKAEQSSELYIASGDTTDWSYGEHKIISFTFELDPANSWGTGGFYPGAKVIPEVVSKNLEPILYLMEYADNPYRVLDGSITFPR